MRPAVIYATHRPPLPLDGGSRIRVNRLITGLARHADVTLVTYADGPTFDDTSTSRDEVAASLPGVRIEFIHYAQPHPAGLRRHMFARSSASYGHHATAGLTAAIQRLCDERPSVLHLDDPGVGIAGEHVRATVKAFSPHNIEHRILYEISRDRPLLQRLPLEAEWRKIRAEEKRLYRACDLSLAVSEIDAASMRAMGAEHVVVVPNGADAGSPTPWQPPANGEPLRLLFVGTGNYWPYEIGIAWFVREAMPRLRADGPVVLDVVGAPPTNPVHGEGVTYHGRVPEVESFYEKTHALVIPVFQGSGTRLKVVEAAMLDRPIISTELGAEGLGVKAGQHYIGAEAVEQWVAATRVIREQPERVRAMTAAAAAKLEDLVWPRIGDALAELYASELAQRTGTR